MEPSAHSRDRNASLSKVKPSKLSAKEAILGLKDRKLAKARVRRKCIRNSTPTANDNLLNVQLRAAKVPKPIMSNLTPLPNKEAFLRYCQAKAHTWVTKADTFILSVDINDLKARPKNTEELKLSAAQHIKAMEAQPEDARSAIFKDKNGITLACVLAWRVPGCPKLTDVSTNMPSYNNIALTYVTPYV